MNVPQLQKHFSRILPLRFVLARPRFFTCALIGALTIFLMPQTWRLVTRILIGWNVATILFLVAIALMMARASHEKMRRNAKMHDEGQYTILVLAVLAAIASFGAIIVQLGIVKDSVGLTKALHLSLAVCTIVSAWTFIHVMFALHYAHEYFDEWREGKDELPELRGGLQFLGIADFPAYKDFVYYAFTIGVATATADVNITSSQMRQITLVHSVLSFFFNMALLGLTINIAAGLI